MLRVTLGCCCEQLVGLVLLIVTPCAPPPVGFDHYCGRATLWCIVRSWMPSYTLPKTQLRHTTRYVRVERLYARCATGSHTARCHCALGSFPRIGWLVTLRLRLCYLHPTHCHTRLVPGYPDCWTTLVGCLCYVAATLRRCPLLRGRLRCYVTLVIADIAVVIVDVVVTLLCLVVTLLRLVDCLCLLRPFIVALRWIGCYCCFETGVSCSIPTHVPSSVPSSQPHTLPHPLDLHFPDTHLDTFVPVFTHTVTIVACCIALLPPGQLGL